MTLPIYAQNNISGTYYDEYGNFIEIDKNLMKLIRKETPGYPGALLAECSLKWIDKQFIELNSTPPIQIAHKGFEMIQFCDSTITKDSVEVSFFLPYHDPLQIVVFTYNTYKSYEMCIRDSGYTERLLHRRSSCSNRTAGEQLLSRQAGR